MIERPRFSLQVLGRSLVLLALAAGQPNPAFTAVDDSFRWPHAALPSSRAPQFHGSPLRRGCGIHAKRHGRRSAGGRPSWRLIADVAARVSLIAVTAVTGAAVAVQERVGADEEFPDWWKKLFWPNIGVLRGNFAPVADEHMQTPLQVVEGNVPCGFPVGAFFRNGPNPRGVRPGAPYHWFEGHGTVHQVRFHHAGDLPTYSNRWVRTQSFKTEQALTFPIWGGEISKNPFTVLFNAVLNFSLQPLVALLAGDTEVKGKGNTTVFSHAGSVVAATETSPPAEIHFDTLETLGVAPWKGLQGEPFTAHPKQMPNGDLRCFNYQVFGTPEVVYGVLDVSGVSRHRSVIPMEANCFLHDLAATERWSILLDSGFAFEPPVTYDNSVPLRFGLIPALGGECQWLEAKPGLILHILNAYEEGEDVVVIGCRFDDFNLFPCEEGKCFVDPALLARLWEWRLHPATGTVTERPLLDMQMEFPRINEEFVGRRCRWGYGARNAIYAQYEAGAPLFSALAKIDVEGAARGSGDAAAQLHEFGEGEFCGEGVFVPRVGAVGEDDGWVCCLTHNELSGVSEFRIIDARDFGGPPVCRLRLPRRVPYGFHAAWVPEPNPVNAAAGM